MIPSYQNVVLTECVTALDAYCLLEMHECVHDEAEKNEKDLDEVLRREKPADDPELKGGAESDKKEEKSDSGRYGRNDGRYGYGRGNFGGWYGHNSGFRGRGGFRRDRYDNYRPGHGRRDRGEFPPASQKEVRFGSPYIV